MYATTLIAIFLLHVGFLVAFPAVWLTWRALAPGWIARSQRAVSKRPWLSAFTGLGVGLVWFVVGIGLASAPAAPLQFLGVLSLMVFTLYAMAGVSAFAAHLGSNLPSPADTERPWKATLRGGIPLELTWVLPVLGWFVLLPLSLMIGAGAATLGIFGVGSRNEAAAPAPSGHEYVPVVPKSEPAAALHA